MFFRTASLFLRPLQIIRRESRCAFVSGISLTACGGVISSVRKNFVCYDRQSASRVTA
jgi:hypothetical protein